VRSLTLMLGLYLFLTGCGSMQDFTRPTTLQSLSGNTRTSAGPLLYVSGHRNNVVDIYDARDPLKLVLVDTISNGVSKPAGISLDAAGTLYVANESGTVTIYPSGVTVPSLTLTQGLSKPVDVATDPSGNVYVADAGSQPKIVKFPAGTSTPSETITNKAIVQPTQLTFDTTGNMFYSDIETGVYEAAAGKKTFTTLVTQPSFGIVLNPSMQLLYAELRVTPPGGGHIAQIFELGVNGGIGGNRKKERPGGGTLAYGCAGGTREPRCIWEADPRGDKLRAYRLNRRRGAPVHTQTDGTYGLAVRP
jgi:hypothetical protein